MTRGVRKICQSETRFLRENGFLQQIRGCVPNLSEGRFPYRPLGNGG